MGNGRSALRATITPTGPSWLPYSRIDDYSAAISISRPCPQAGPMEINPEQGQNHSRACQSTACRSFEKKR
jgi:hypothetical protein